MKLVKMNVKIKNGVYIGELYIKFKNKTRKFIGEITINKGEYILKKEIKNGRTKNSNACE